MNVSALSRDTFFLHATPTVPKSLNIAGTTHWAITLKIPYSPHAEVAYGQTDFPGNETLTA